MPTQGILSQRQGVDFVVNNSWYPEAFLTNGNIRTTAGQLVTNAVLTRTEWANVEREVFAAVTRPLTLVSTLIEKGLVQPGSLANLVHEWGMGDEAEKATINMTGEVRVPDSDADAKNYGTPVPFFLNTFKVNLRRLLQSRQLGTPLSLLNAITVSKKHGESIEDAILNGANVSHDQAKFLGLTTHPNRLKGVPTDFSGSGGPFGIFGNAYNTINGAISKLNENGYYGPFGVFVSTAQFNKTNVLSSNDRSEASLIRDLASVEFFRVCPALDSSKGSMLIIQLTPEVVNLVMAMDTQMRSMTTWTQMVMRYLLVSCLSIQIVVDQNDNTGYAHITDF